VTYDGKTLGQDLGQRTILLAGGKIRGVKPSLETVLLSFTDVTEARSLQDQSMRLLLREQEARALADRANRAKDIFLATLSHELRTPLSSIMTWSQLIARGKVDFDKAKEGARVIEQSAYVQTQLIDDLLDVSRIIAGKLSLDIQEVDPVYVMQLAIQAIGSMSEKKNVLIEFESHVDQCFILADPIRLQQIFWNLLINAVKFSHLAGKITVKIEFLEQIKRRFVKMQVIDRGNGIPVDFLPHIFARFIQADSAPARTHGGLGLGLSIVENLVHLHGGFVSAANASVGRGAVFTLQFPIVMHPESIIVRSSEQASQGREQIESAKSAPSLNGLNILFVDDDENAREAVAIYLRSFGAAVVALGSAAEAMAELGEKLPDIIISDIAMPSEDGYSFIGRVRALSVGQGGRTPAIALTAYVTKDDAKRALDAGFQAHLSKPVDAHQLGRVIALLLKRTLN
jgi:signal transduction histidine kinase/ActR/RegA family two-component response regulator